jgi:hypothetical protein
VTTTIDGADAAKQSMTSEIDIIYGVACSFPYGKAFSSHRFVHAEVAVFGDVFFNRHHFVYVQFTHLSRYKKGKFENFFTGKYKCFLRKIYLFLVGLKPAIRRA